MSVGGEGEAAAGEPTDALKDFFGAVNVVLTDPTTEDQPLLRLRAIRRHVDDVFDFREAAMLALGREWAARTPVEQNEFVALFADLLERSFVWRVAGKATTAGGVKVGYLGETGDRETATVETAIDARDGNAMRLDFRMVRRTGRWVVRDVVMDGVSTMANYHAQFQRLARDGSWPDLMAQLRAKVGGPAGTVQVAAAPPPVMWPSELRASDPGAEAVVPVAAGPVPTAIARPLETAVVSSRTAPYAVPAPMGPRTSGAAAVTAATPAPNGKVPTLDPARTPNGKVSTPGSVPPSTPSSTPPAPRPAPIAPPDVAVPRPPRQLAAATSSGELAVDAPPRRDVPRIEPTPAAPPASARPQKTPAYWVQVGAYRSATAAGRVAGLVEGEIFVVASPAAREPLLRVRVGPFPDRGRARARLNELKARGWKVFIAESRD